MRIVKYPRTQHIEGSRLQQGDHDLESVPFRRLHGRHLVVEEKLDGANAAFRFDAEGRIHLQSRGHFLIGGHRERHFDLFKRWATAKAPDLWPVLRDRFVVYGEWMYAKHTVYYDSLPHYFLEFDVLDLQEDRFLSTPARRRLLGGLPIASVPVMHSGAAGSLRQLTDLLGRSHFKGPDWRDRLVATAASLDLDVDLARRETDPSDEMEGLYLKVESEDRVLERYKFVRASFLSAVVDSGTHWLQRPIVPNRLAEGVDIWS
ncbi:MAG: RNA ligase family protein [Planctomycetota bacterium]